ncbi:Tetratricopeptide repeat-containing protein [Aquimarina amphilecti]|uniref:Tetratricopeptide repeat-containing protein n=1 Tax=Aquimarina amphilecti TaxID=1038014 RepID=A0A1H7L6C7_AQUAM|nr:tetratricopeptide repeat protein [Aquimarina amphilecti]SEK94552.1 Tetratricopeptide repeat-containing protein [Aquimarina amphilecti]
MTFSKVYFLQIISYHNRTNLIVCIVLGFFFFSNLSYGFQEKTKVDSLHNLINTNDKENAKKVDLLNTIGFEYWIIDANESIHFGKEALQISKKIGYSKGKARANRIIGVAYWAQGHLNTALTYLNTSYKLYNTIEDQVGLANTKLNIGMVYADLKEYKKALNFYEEAINEFTALGLKGRIATTFTKIGTILIDQEKDAEALKYLTDALRMHTDTNFTYGIAEAHNKLGILYLHKDEIEQAYYHIRKSMELGNKVNDIDGLTNNHIIHGKILRLSNKLDEATVEIRKGLKSAKENKLKKYELFAYEELKEIKKLQAKPEEALAFYDKFIFLRDSLLNLEKSKQIAYLEFENQLERKDKELVALKEQEEKDNLIQFILILSVAIISIFGSLIYIISRQRTRKSRQLAVKKQELLESAHAFAQKDLENLALKQQELQQQLDFKNKELSSYALNFIKKNEIVQQLQETIQKIKKSSSIEKQQLITDLNKIIKKNLSIDKDWEDFSRFFEDAHQGFYARLKSKHPDLSSNDLKICSLIRLNLNIKETASILGISPESVKTARYRLRKKIELDPKQEILTYLLQLEE